MFAGCGKTPFFEGYGLRAIERYGLQSLRKWDLPHFRCRVKLRLKHPKAVLALLAARNLPARTSVSSAPPTEFVAAC
jgi:hypothetical protein